MHLDRPRAAVLDAPWQFPEAQPEMCKTPQPNLYADWQMHRVFLIVLAHAIVAQWLESFKEFPQRQKPASFNLDEVMRKLSETPGSGK